MAAIILAAALTPLAAAGCDACVDSGICDAVEQRYRIDRFHIERRESFVFPYDGADTRTHPAESRERAAR